MQRGKRVYAGSNIPITNKHLMRNDAYTAETTVRVG
jgi:hypothetical protein